MSTVRGKLANQLVKLAYGRLSTTDIETAYFDFGTPDNINLATATTSAPGLGYRAGDRLLAVITTDSDGTTSAITATILDAPDSSGSIGSTAAAVVDGTLLMGTGDKATAYGIVVQPGRPWIKIGVSNDNATDTVLCYCTVWAIPRAGF